MSGVFESVLRSVKESEEPTFLGMTKEQAKQQFREGVKAPFVVPQDAPLDGAEIFVRVSFQSPEQWKNGILQNSANFTVSVASDGSMEMVACAAGKLRMRRHVVKSVRQAVSDVNRYIDSVRSVAPPNWDGGGLALLDHLNGGVR